LTKSEFNQTFLDLLVCPQTGEKLIFDSQKKLLNNENGSISYPIKEGIPYFILKKDGS